MAKQRKTESGFLSMSAFRAINFQPNFTTQRGLTLAYKGAFGLYEKAVAHATCSRVAGLIFTASTVGLMVKSLLAPTWDMYRLGACAILNGCNYIYLLRGHDPLKMSRAHLAAIIGIELLFAQATGAIAISGAFLQATGKLCSFFGERTKISGHHQTDTLHRLAARRWAMRAAGCSLTSRGLVIYDAVARGDDSLAWTASSWWVADGFLIANYAFRRRPPASAPDPGGASAKPQP